MSVSARIEAIQNLHATHSIISSLEQSKSSVEGLIDEMPEALFVLSQDGSILKANVQATRLLKVEPEHGLGSNIGKIFDAEAYKLLANKLQLIEQNPDQYQHPHHFELQVVMGRDDVRPFHWALRPLVPGRFKKIPLFVLSGRSLVDLYEFERELSKIYSNIPIGILSIGPGGLIEPNYSRYTEYLLQHPNIPGLNNGFAQVSIVELLYKPAFADMRPADLEACNLVVEAIGQSERWFDEHRSRFPQLLRRALGSVELWLKLSYYPISVDGQVQKVLMIIENRTDLIREREERNVWIRRNETVVRRILEIQNAEKSLVFQASHILVSLLDRLDRALKKPDLQTFKEGCRALRLLADQAGFLTLKSSAEQLELKVKDAVSKGLSAELAEYPRLYSEVRHEARELLRLFHTLYPEAELIAAPLLRSDVNIYQNTLEAIDRSLQLAGPHAEIALLESLQQVRSHVLGLSAVPLTQLEADLRKAAETQAKSLAKELRLECIFTGIYFPMQWMTMFGEVLSVLLQNSIEHGIETKQERKAQAKTEQAKVRIEIKQVGAEIHVFLADDGRGLDLSRLRSALKERALFDETVLNQMSEGDLLAQIFQSKLFAYKIDQIGPVSDLTGVKRFLDDVLASDVRVNSTPGRGASLQFRLKF